MWLLILPLLWSLMCSFNHDLVSIIFAIHHLFINSSIDLSIYLSSSIYPFLIHSSIHPVIYSSINLYIYSSIHHFIHHVFMKVVTLMSKLKLPALLLQLLRPLQTGNLRITFKISIHINVYTSMNSSILSIL